jgi:hypothetical protein
MDFGHGTPRRLVLNAQKLDYGSGDQTLLLLTITDVTDARISERLKDDLLREISIAHNKNGTDASPPAKAA